MEEGGYKYATPNISKKASKYISEASGNAKCYEVKCSGIKGQRVGEGKVCSGTSLRVVRGTSEWNLRSDSSVG